MLKAEDVVRFLGSDVLTIVDPNPNESVRIISAGQWEIYSTLLKVMNDNIAPPDTRREAVVGKLEETIKRALIEWPPVIMLKGEPDPQGDQIVSRLPVLHPDHAKMIISKIPRKTDNESHMQKRRAVSVLIAGIVVELSDRDMLATDGFEHLDPDILSALVEYKVEKWSLEKSEGAEIEIGGAYGRLALEINSAKTTLATLIDEQKAQAIQIGAQIGKLEIDKSKLEAELVALEKTIGSRHAEIEAHLTGYQRATEAKLNLNVLGNLWSSRARQAFHSTWIAAMVLATLCGFGIFAVLCWGPEIMNFVAPRDIASILLGNNATAAIGHQLGRVLLVSVPVVLYFWLIKMMVRFLIRSILIYDDASQRQTIMESYTLLLRDGMDDQRALPMLLWAIFRQVPGHGPDGIDPPDFTEVINAGMKKSYGSTSN
ncbi:hypothetical protein DXT91_10355 [Agrobacterium tumefaciens]|uniref:hypothetical protein n=1 Tax=Agrobacterium tumefaciens TaxID=358 RepID=UPI0012B7D49B|nr:hypothetical protein [Agrobacterium tumefaciens]MQB04530.1 hypothetical protein [Agrobacterium tumefaciens]